jgi:ribosomal protein S18 acetylase RimI-like enzyme
LAKEKGTGKEEERLRTDELLIREATEEDVSALVELVNEAYAIEDFLEGTRTDSARMSEKLEKGKIFVAIEASCSQIVACVYAKPRGRDAAASVGHAGYLGMLAVNPKLQGAGIARRMMEAAESYFRAEGCTRVEISVLSMRSELLPIYRHYGFEETGTEAFGFHRALKPGVECHTILMAKAL